MSKKSSGWSSLTIAVTSILAGFLVLLTGPIGEFAFVVIVIVVVWDSSNKLGSLQKKVSEIESRLSGQSPPVPPPP